MKFTDRQIQALKPQAKRYDQWEGNGLGIRVSPQGRKSWVMVYRFDGRPRYVTLGVYPRMTVAHAHEAHGKALVAVATGIDPGPGSSKPSKLNVRPPLLPGWWKTTYTIMCAPTFVAPGSTSASWRKRCCRCGAPSKPRT